MSPIGLAILAVGLAVGWTFFRKKTNKIMLSVALAIVGGGIIRLYDLVQNDKTILPAVAALSVLGAIWLVAWLLNRSISRKPERAAAKRPSGPPRVGLR